MDDLEEQLSCSRVEDEDRTVDRLGRQVTLERLREARTNKGEKVTEKTRETGMMAFPVPSVHDGDI